MALDNAHSTDFRDLRRCVRNGTAPSPCAAIPGAVGKSLAGLSPPKKPHKRRRSAEAEGLLPSKDTSERKPAADARITVLFGLDSSILSDAGKGQALFFRRKP